MRKQAVQRPWYSGEVQVIDKRLCVLALPAADGAHEAPQLLLDVPLLLGWLFLEDTECPQVALGVDDLLHGGGTERADQLLFQVGDAHVETERLHVGASEVAAETCSLQGARKVAFLSGVTQARQSDVEPLRTQQIQESADAGRTSERDDGDALHTEGAAVTRSQRFERDLVADPFNEYGRAQSGAGSQFECGRGGCWSPRTASRPLDDRLTEPPYRIHRPQFLSRGRQAATSASRSTSPGALPLPGSARLAGAPVGQQLLTELKAPANRAAPS
jgi:hypothetical protein